MNFNVATSADWSGQAFGPGWVCAALTIQFSDAESAPWEEISKCWVCEAEPFKEQTVVCFRNTSHANTAQGITGLVVLADYQFVWVWNSKQTLEGVNTDVNQNQKKSKYKPMRIETKFLYCSCLKGKYITKWNLCSTILTVQTLQITSKNVIICFEWSAGPLRWEQGQAGGSLTVQTEARSD